MNCWEYMDCLPEIYKNCPAYPDKGLDCWKVTGTRCDHGRMEKASVTEKIEFCRTCGFYNDHAHKF